MTKHVSRSRGARRSGHAGHSVDAGTIAVWPGPASRRSYTAGRYLVTFADAPVAEYSGYVKGFPATRAAAGKKLNAHSAAAKKWQQRLTGVHDKALAKVGAKKIYDYTVANNGVAVSLSARQADEAAKAAASSRLEKDQRAQLDTTLSPHFLGLDAAGGIWDQLRGSTRTPEPASSSASSTPASGPRTRRSPAAPASRSRPTGTAPASPARTGARSTCNDKLIGARYYDAGFGTQERQQGRLQVARDGSGHGSHTASTAAGQLRRHDDHRREHDRRRLGHGPGREDRDVQGVLGPATACRTAASTPTASPRSTTRWLDGVDVLNYSIGGSRVDVLDSVAQAFRGASNAGVFVANSAGNSGPGVSTLDHPAPWVTTVAASTFRRAFQAVELGNGNRYIGASTTLSLPTLTSLVTAGERQARRGGRGRREPLLRGHARPGQDGRQDRPVRSWRRTPASTRASRSSAPAAWAWSWPTSRQARSTATTTPSRRSTSRDRRRGRQDLHHVGRRRRDGQDRAAHRGRARRRPAGPRDHRFLVARSVHDDRRRHPQAGHRGSRQRRRRGGRPADQPRPDLGLHVGHVDGVAAHRRHRRAAEGAPPELDAVRDQVGDHDERRRHGLERG